MKKIGTYQEARLAAERFGLALGDVLNAFDLRDPNEETRIFEEFMAAPEDDLETLWKLYRESLVESDISDQIIEAIEKSLEKKLEELVKEGDKEEIWNLYSQWPPIGSGVAVKMLLALLALDKSEENCRKVLEEVKVLAPHVQAMGEVLVLTIQLLCENEEIAEEVSEKSVA
jgi:hypothetical protein